MGIAASRTGKLDDAISLFRECIQLNPDLVPCHLSLVAAYYEVGDEKKARVEVAEVLRINPDFSVDKWARRLPIKGDAVENVTSAWSALAPE